LTFNFLKFKFFIHHMPRKKSLLIGLLSSFFSITVVAQSTQTFNEKEVATTLSILSADEMAGRQTFGSTIHLAAGYIADEFLKYGLQPLPGLGSYLQSFVMINSKPLESSKVTVGTDAVSAQNIISQTSEKKLNITPASGFEVIRLNEGDNAMATFRSIRGKKGNVLVLMHSSHEPFFMRVKQNAAARMKSETSIVFILTTQSTAETFDIAIENEITEIKLSNVAGMIPGKTKPDEYVIFSGHYDHIGIGKPNEKGDSIYNGANDDASGTTAVMMLAKHFATVGQNERTIIFAAFTAEEVGGFGSQYFSKQLDPAKVVAMFNIEMIGTDSKWGTNSAYITGYEKTNMGEILQKNLAGSPFQFHPDPYPEQQLFYRSDNATLARLGVPAHTISTSKMDNEPHYHKASDEIGTLDTKNMTEIIRTIAISSKSIVDGKDTPSRVDTSQLNR
jgi:hypothetical protein